MKEWQYEKEKCLRFEWNETDEKSSLNFIKTLICTHTYHIEVCIRCQTWAYAHTHTRALVHTETYTERNRPKEREKEQEKDTDRKN